MNGHIDANGRIDANARAGERTEMLRYISEMTGELAAIAGAARMPMLTYFLNMARVEAEMQLSEDAPASHV
ncbi:MAG: hypothetical protein ACK5JM_01800 [Rhodoblastus sp.]